MAFPAALALFFWEKGGPGTGLCDSGDQGPLVPWVTPQGSQGPRGHPEVHGYVLAKFRWFPTLFVANSASWIGISVLSDWDFGVLDWDFGALGSWPGAPKGPQWGSKRLQEPQKGDGGMHGLESDVQIGVRMSGLTSGDWTDLGCMG